MGSELEQMSEGSLTQNHVVRLSELSTWQEKRSQMSGMMANTVSSSLWEAEAGICEFKALLVYTASFRSACLKKTKDEILNCVRLLHVHATERLVILTPDGCRRSQPTVDQSG